MPYPRTVILLKCVASPDGRENGQFWMGETFATSDGPRMRILTLPADMDEGRALAEVDRRNQLLKPPVPLKGKVNILGKHVVCTRTRCVSGHVRHCPKGK